MQQCALVKDVVVIACNLYKKILMNTWHKVVCMRFLFPLMCDQARMARRTWIEQQSCKAGLKNISGIVVTTFKRSLIWQFISNSFVAVKNQCVIKDLYHIINIHVLSNKYLILFCNSDADASQSIQSKI